MLAFLDKFIITGGTALKGEVTVSGAKNAVVAILPATILCEDKCVIENVPDISDVHAMIEILESMGAKIRYLAPATLEIDTSTIASFRVEHDYTYKLRASYYLIGALLGRFKRAKVAMPGGCYLGVRPIDQHIKGFEALGADVTMEENAMVNAYAEELIGNSIYFDIVSVGATINLMLASVKAQGLTVIENAAKEPHIVDLANFLNIMGADIRGAGTDIIRIHGVKQLHGCEYSIIPDQIEAGTFMVAAAATHGDILIKNVIPKHLESISRKLIESGATVIDFDDKIKVKMDGRARHANIKTMPHPGFPTDMQPQFTTLLAMASGRSIVSESIWDNRFRYVEQLIRMGANIRVDGKTAVVEGVERLRGASVHADDLRAGAAMIIAGMSAIGKTEITEISHIERGYSHVVEKFRSLGAIIEKKNDDEPQYSENIEAV